MSNMSRENLGNNSLLIKYSDKLPASAIETELTAALMAGVAREAALAITIREGIARETALEAALLITIREGEAALAKVIRDGKDELAEAVRAGAAREALLETAVLDLTLSRSFALLFKRKEKIELTTGAMVC